MKQLLAILFLLFATSNICNASHTVGGEWKYEHLFGSNYRFTFFLYRDCLNGADEALLDDLKSGFAIFQSGSFNAIELRDIQLNQSNASIVPTGFSNNCIKNPPPVCLSLLKFTFEANLPNPNQTYYLVYQRCCRNEAVNVKNIGGQSIGSTLFATVNLSQGPNNSATANSFPPQIICINNPLNYDDSYIDPDGDSLSYELCEAYDFSNNQSTSPNPTASEIKSPPYQPITYANGFSATSPMTANPGLSINPVTGILTGTPNRIGRFVITLCCKEWRNGVMIANNRRDFQFEVTNCTKAVVANTPLFSTENNTYIIECQGYKVDFKNSSQGGFDYFWDFGVPGISTDVSSAFEPSYTYPDTGTYLVKLVVNRNSTCPDSITRLVKIYPTFTSDYTSGGLLCPLSQLSFTDLSSSTLTPPSYWNWNFGDGIFSNIQNPSHAFATGGQYPVTLTSGNSFGCRDTTTRIVKLPKVDLILPDDTIVLKNLPLQLYARGAVTYTWTPNSFMDNPNSSNPNFVFPTVGSYTYIVNATTKDSCLLTDTVVVYVADDFILYVPNAFSPNGDFVNDVLRLTQGGFTKVNYFRIYNRFGQQLFYTTDIKDVWDGTHNGQPAEQGVYFWQAAATKIDGTQLKLKGDVTLLR
jgi:gliding motility-associated-like protein